MIGKEAKNIDCRILWPALGWASKEPRQQMVHKVLATPCSWWGHHSTPHIGWAQKFLEARIQAQQISCSIQYTKKLMSRWSGCGLEELVTAFWHQHVWSWLAKSYWLGKLLEHSNACAFHWLHNVEGIEACARPWCNDATVCCTVRVVGHIPHGVDLGRFDVANISWNSHNKHVCIMASVVKAMVDWWVPIM